MRMIRNGAVVMTAMVLSAAICFGAGSSDKAKPGAVKETAKPTKFILGSEPLAISWWQNYDSSTTGVWPKRQGEFWMRDQFKVTIEQPGSNGAAAQQLSFMIVENKFYDILQLERGQDLDKLITAGKLLPLDPYLEGSELVKGLGADIINLLRAPDGKLYSFPNWAIGPERLNGNAGYFVNAKIYNEMGRPSLATFEDLETYLRAVRAKYPEVIPFEVGQNFGGWETVFNSMGSKNASNYMKELFAYPKDGKFVPITQHPDFRESAAYLSRLFRDRIITQDGFTQTRDQAREKLTALRFAVMAYGDAANEADWARKTYKTNIDPNAEPYEFIQPVLKKGMKLDGAKLWARNRLGWNVNVITKDAKNPAGAFALMDWMFGPEGSAVAKLGPPGLYWERNQWKDGFPIAKDTWFTATAVDLKDLGHLNWCGNTSFQDTLGVLLNDDPRTLPSAKNWKQTQFSKFIWKYSYDATDLANLIPARDTEIGIIYQTVKDMMKQYYAEIMFSTTEEELAKSLAKAEKAILDAGFQKVLDAYTVKWTENRKKLGWK